MGRGPRRVSVAGAPVISLRPALDRFGHHVLLLLAVAALAAAAWRAASALGLEKLERLIAAVVFAAALAVLEALGLGLLSLGGNPYALMGAAGLTWLASRGLAPRGPSLASELSDWLRDAATPLLIAVGAAGGVLLMWAAWKLPRPDVGLDGLYYHLPEIVTWVQEGAPGSVEQIHPWLEVGSYPIAHEVLVAWGVAISQSLVWQGILTLGLLPAAIASAWIGLRELAVPVSLRWLAIAAVFSLPILAHQIDGPAADVPALIWLVCAAGLGVAARHRHVLLSPALVAAGLTIGTKTTVLPLATLLVIALVVQHRRHLCDRGWLLGSSAAAAAVVGATWYLRDLIDHGSPFWPFAASPWGDPVPELLDSFTSLFADPGAALEGNIVGYMDSLAGGWLLLAAAVLAPLWSRRRAVVVGALLTLGSVLLWSLAPTTGASSYEGLSARISGPLPAADGRPGGHHAFPQRHRPWSRALRRPGCSRHSGGLESDDAAHGQQRACLLQVVASRRRASGEYRAAPHRACLRLGPIGPEPPWPGGRSALSHLGRWCQSRRCRLRVHGSLWRA